MLGKGLASPVPHLDAKVGVYVYSWVLSGTALLTHEGVWPVSYGQLGDVPISQIQEVPQERVQNRTVEQIVDVSTDHLTGSQARPNLAAYRGADRHLARRTVGRSAEVRVSRQSPAADCRTDL